jgi:hypothetical protein
VRDTASSLPLLPPCGAAARVRCAWRLARGRAHSAARRAGVAAAADGGAAAARGVQRCGVARCGSDAAKRAGERVAHVSRSMAAAPDTYRAARERGARR